MNSPFSGMDPFIEACGLWEDFHHDLIGEIKDSLARVVPEKYVVRTGERAYVVLAQREGKEVHSFVPDVGVATRGAVIPQAGVALADPATDSGSVAMRAFCSIEFREAFIEVYTTQPDRQLVTCIEVLSPSNKRANSPGWDLYQRKRQSLLMGEANLVEIDLLRGGQRMPMLDPWPESPYFLLVARRATAPVCRVWQRYSLRPLPNIPIPLVHPDPDLFINLQPMIETVYRRSRYDRDIDYAKPCSSLSAEENNWLAKLKQT